MKQKLSIEVLFGIFAISAAGAVLWTIYALYRGDTTGPAIVAASALAVLAFIILLPKIMRSNSDSMQSI